MNAFSCKRRKEHALKGAEALSPGQHPGYKAISRTKDASSTPEGAEAHSPGQRPGYKAISRTKDASSTPEGAEAHSPGQRPGYKAISNAPCKGKSFKTPGIFLKLLPLQVGCVGQTFERGI